VFHNLGSTSIQTDADRRFNYFLEEVLPVISKQRLKHVLVFIPSYFDFVRLRNHLKRRNKKVAQICEYTSQSNVTRAKSYLFHGERAVMLYTERYHFHNRARFRKIEHVVFYQLPTYPQFYSEVLNTILPQAAADATCTVLYSKFDQLRLQRVVGSDRAARMQASDRPTHMFV
jgi:U3 small nucleolar RNA-associated protein 25